MKFSGFQGIKTPPLQRKCAFDLAALAAGEKQQQKKAANELFDPPPTPLALDPISYMLNKSSKPSKPHLNQSRSAVDVRRCQDQRLSRCQRKLGHDVDV